MIFAYYYVLPPNIAKVLNFFPLSRLGLLISPLPRSVPYVPPLDRPLRLIDTDTVPQRFGTRFRPMHPKRDSGPSDANQTSSSSPDGRAPAGSHPSGTVASPPLRHDPRLSSPMARCIPLPPPPLPLPPTRLHRTIALPMCRCNGAVISLYPKIVASLKKLEKKPGWHPPLYSTSWHYAKQSFGPPEKLASELGA